MRKIMLGKKAAEMQDPLAQCKAHQIPNTQIPVKVVSAALKIETHYHLMSAEIMTRNGQE